MLSVGALAKQGSVGVPTLRYYERRGLLLAPERTAAGYRQYPEEAVRRLAFIRRAQTLGFTLKEIGDLLSLRVRSGRNCTDVMQAARRTRRRVRQRMDEMKRFDKALGMLIKSCEKRRATDDCPILQSLDSARAP